MVASSNPNDYNTEAWARWRQYADDLEAHFLGEGDHPGEPPAGYRELYRLHHRHALLPEHQPPPHHTQPAPGAPGAPTFNGMRGVAMSEDAFATLLQQNNIWADKFSRFAEHLHTTTAGRSLVAVAPGLNVPLAPRAHLHGHGRGLGQRGGYRGRGGSRNGRGHAPGPPRHRGGGLLARIGRDGLPIDGQQRGRSGGTHSRGRRGGQDRRERDSGRQDGTAGEPQLDDSMHFVLDRLADLFGEADLEGRPEDGAGDPMEVDGARAVSEAPERRDDEDEGRERSVSPCISGIGDSENRGPEEDGRM
uniref:RxLR effector candidate n=1 Tax=Ganoderma boninense TaxID=34458 RepID=A0A5K1K6D6_9APHY